MAPSAGEATQTPSSGSSVQGEMHKKPASQGVGRGVTEQQGPEEESRQAASEQRGRWAGGSPRRWHQSRNQIRVGRELDRRPGAEEGLPQPPRPLLTPCASDNQALQPTPHPTPGLRWFPCFWLRRRWIHSLTCSLSHSTNLY